MSYENGFWKDKRQEGTPEVSQWQIMKIVFVHCNSYSYSKFNVDSTVK